MEETKTGTEMLNKCRLFCSFIYPLILSKESGTLPQSQLWPDSHVVSPCSSKGFCLQFYTISLLGALSCLGRNPPVLPLSAGVEELMEHKQAPEQSARSELPDTGGIQVQAAYSTVERLKSVPDLKKQGQVDLQVPGL